jgi:hypothetical protein
MDAETLQKALDSIESGDAEAAKEILKQLIVEAAATGGAPSPRPAADPVADPTDPTDPTAKTGGGDKYEPSARAAARKESPVTDPDKATLRARKEAQDAADEIKAIAADQRATAKESLVAGLRARLGERLTPAAIKRIVDAPTYQHAKDLASFAEEFGCGPQRARARDDSGAPITIEPAPGDAPPALKAEDLVKEGLPQALAADLAERSKTDPKLAQHELGRARARLAKATNPWLPKEN